MKRILLLTLTMLAGVTIALAQEQTNQPGPKRVKPPLTDEQRAQKEQQLNKAWDSLPLESKIHLMRLHRALSEMPPNERRFIHDRIERFLNMTPAEREKLTQLRKKWEQMTPDERQKAREEFRKRRQAFDEKWRQEHPGQEPPPFPPHKPKGPPPPLPSDSEGAPPAPEAQPPAPPPVGQ
jgi:Protein of unknown function (DUF3106)